MRKFLRFALYFALFIVLSLLIFISYIEFSGIPKYTAQAPDIVVTSTPERLKQGQRLATTLCTECHYNPETGKLTGKYSFDLPKMFGEIYSKNITHDPMYGIGKWTDGEILYFLRTGVRRDGSFVPAYMPKFPLMADEDLYSIIAWLRSDDPRLLPSTVEAPESAPSFMTKLLSNTVMKPHPYPTEKINLPDTNNVVELGKYLATASLACYACHSKDFAQQSELYPEQSLGFFGGGNPMIRMDGSEVITPNITMNKQNGIGNWTEAEFIEAVKYGKTKHGQLIYPMIPFVQYSDKEIASIFAYLKTVPVL